MDPFDMPGPGPGMFTAVPVIMGLIFAAVVVLVILNLVRAGSTFATNAALPKETVAAKVVAKRTQAQGGVGDSPVHTSYFATFQTTDGGRVEVRVPAAEYGQLAEGDEGQLTHQGTRYHGFERRRVIPLDGTWEAPGGPSLPPPEA